MYFVIELSAEFDTWKGRWLKKFLQEVGYLQYGADSLSPS